MHQTIRSARGLIDRMYIRKPEDFLEKAGSTWSRASAYMIATQQARSIHGVRE